MPLVRSVALAISLGCMPILFGCDEAPDAPAQASASTTSEPTRAPSAAAPASNTPAPAPPVPENVANATVSGRSLSVADGGNVSDALKSVGWRFLSSGGMGVGSKKSTTIKAEKGDLKAEILMVQPTGKPDSIGTTTTIRSAAEQEKELRQRNAATYLEGETLIAVTIENEKDEATKLLNALVHNQVNQ